MGISVNVGSSCSMNTSQLPPATKLGQGNVFTGVCDSVNRGVSASVHAGIPHLPGADTRREQTPPRADTPQSRHPPGADPPLEQTPPEEQTPPSRPTPMGEIEGIRSRPTPMAEIEGDQIQAHTQGGN